MEIRKGVTAAVIVSREWANLDVIRLIFGKVTTRLGKFGVIKVI